MSVVDFPRDGVVCMARGPRSLDVPVEAVLAGAENVADRLQQVLVCGITEDGLYAAGSSNSVGDTILLLERIKAHLMSKYSGDEFA